MTYQEMADALESMSEHERRQAIRTYWQDVLSDGFIAYVQGQIEAGRSMSLSRGGFEKILDGLDPKEASKLKQQALQQVARLVQVWDSMVAVYQQLQKESERQGPRGGMVDHGQHRAMPRGVDMRPAARCSRCGSPAVDKGLCGGCVAEVESREWDDLRHEEKLQDQQRDDLHFQRIQDDRIFQEMQQDFNNYSYNQ